MYVDRACSEKNIHVIRIHMFVVILILVVIRLGHGPGPALAMLMGVELRRASLASTTKSKKE